MTSNPLRLLVSCLSGLVVLAVLWTAAWLLLLQHRLTRIVTLPGVGLVPEAYRLVGVASTRRIDVGYASFCLPASCRGEAYQVDNAVLIPTDLRFSSPAGGFVMSGLARSDEGPSVAPLLAGYGRTFGGNIRSRFEWEKQVLESLPFSALSILKIGRSEAMRRATLLRLKGVEVGHATAIGIGRTRTCGFIVITRPQMTWLFVEDLRHRAGQGFSISPGRSDPREIVSAIVASYQSRLTGTSEASAEQQLNAAHLKPLPQPSA